MNDAWGRVMDNIRHTIILVDDNVSNLTQGKNILQTYYKVYPAPSAARLFKTLENVIPDLILLDIRMPEMNGYEAIKKLKADTRYADIPVIFLTALDDEDSEVEGFDLGAADYITKPFSASLLLRRITKELLIVQQKRDLKSYANHLENMVREKTAAIFNLQHTVRSTVTDMVKLRDNSTGGHISRTQHYMKALMDEIVRDGLYSDEIEGWNIDLFLQSAQLHDIGKVAITDLILNKPDKLTRDEFEIIKTHVSAGVEAVEKIMRHETEQAFLRHALFAAGTHHEKWDGSGYPTGLKGREIPLEGRLMAIVDVYDALVSERPYKRAFTHEEACMIIKEGAGTHFDPFLVDAFHKVQDEFGRVTMEVSHPLLGNAD
jgi:putative two-component system response regulator